MDWEEIELCKKAFYIDKKLYFVRKLRAKKFFLLLKCNVKRNSYIGLVVSRIFDYWCGNAINLRHEYKKYYKKEYNSFENYLLQKHNLIKSERAVLKKMNACYKDCTNIPERNIDELFREGGLGRVFAEFLEGRKLYED